MNIKRTIRQFFPQSAWDGLAQSKLKFVKAALYLRLFLSVLSPGNFPRFLKNRLFGRSIGFYPMKPQGPHSIRKICLLLGLRMVRTKEGRRPVVQWEDGTFRKESVVGAINSRCVDISKRTVGSVFERVFGYQYMFDPTRHNGRCVRKSNLNALHDGSVIQCPIERADDAYVYQKLVDNEIRPGIVRELRAVIMRSDIPLVFAKDRPIEKRFFAQNTAVTVLEAEQAFSADEIKKILEFCTEMGLEYGELDVLRDRADGRIYVIDVNNTPYGPPHRLSVPAAVQAMNRLSDTFEKKYLA